MGVDTLIKGANLITLHDEPWQPASDALAIHGERICAIGPSAQLSALADQDTRVLDLAGNYLLPGFIDTHVHFTQTGLGALGPQLYGVTSQTIALEVIADAVARLAPGEPLLIHGCSLHDLDGEFSREALDALAPVNPVMLGDVGAHACVVNSQAWKLLDLPARTPGICQGPDGALSGLLLGNANTRARYTFYSKVIDDHTRAEALRRASRLALQAGITTVHTLEGGSPDGRGWLPERDVDVLLAQQAQLPVRTVIYFQSTNVEQAQRWNLPRIGGCIWVDGSYLEHTAALLEPYADEPSSCGCLYFSQQELDHFVQQAHHAGLQISLHAIGDAAIEQVLTAYEAALRQEPRADHRHRIEHFSLPTTGQIERMAAAGITAAMQPNFARHPNADGTSSRLEQLLGPERFVRRHPYRHLLDAGILVAGGSDADPMPMGPLIGIELLASHPEPARRLSVAEAISLYTLNAARAAFEETEKGTLEVGKLADLVVLAEDPTCIAAARIGEIPIELTLVGGRIEHRSGGARE
jgi:predicted amidohydrolase YtcJ